MRGASWPSFTIPVHAIGSHPQPFLPKNGREAKCRFLAFLRSTAAHLAMGYCGCHAPGRRLWVVTEGLRPLGAIRDRWSDC